MGSETMNVTERRYFKRGGSSGTNKGARKNNVLQTLPFIRKPKFGFFFGGERVKVVRISFELGCATPYAKKRSQGVAPDWPGPANFCWSHVER
jgi:hypothetical protein